MDEEEMITKIFIDNTKHKMKEQNMTQKMLAEKVRVSQSTISKYLTGEIIPDCLKAKRIARALGCLLEDLFNEN